MKTLRLLPLTSLLTGVAFAAALPASAQEVVQPLPGTTDADALAAEMRRIAADPRDVDALIDAARLSLRVGDVSAAAVLLQRAGNVDPHNPKVRAGQASVLVQSERPGQALRYFAEAEAQGLDPRTFAADRGLAYDLTGQQERAQRDYARALRDAPNDEETVRRYALSLGISGQRQRALQLLDPLVRRSDRAAWRVQAFVLAMTGDVGGASRIAATMIPGGAVGLSAFFARLPALPPTDRAFAVHFGEVRATPERLADARLAPPLSPLPRDPGVVLASAQPSATQQVRNRRGAAQPVITRPVATLPPAPPAQPIATIAAPIRRELPPAAQPVVTAPARREPGASAAVAAGMAPVQSPIAPPVAGAAAPSRPTPTLAEAREPVAGTLVASALVTTIPSAQPAPAPVPSNPPVQLAAAPSAAAPVDAVPVTVGPAVQAPAAAPPTPAAQPVQVVAIPPSAPPVFSALPARPLPSARTGEDSILARIIAGLSIPGSELGVEESARPVAAAVVQPLPPPVPGGAEPAVAARVEADRAAADKAIADRANADRTAVDKLAADKLAATEKAAAAKVAADKRAAERKAAADKKALAEKKAAAEKKALADKEEAEQQKAERANPERIWVQVAGGAYEGDLPKAFAAVKAKAPAVFGSRTGWTTPLRATNRVLAGPFKTDAEARQFVNDLKKQGVSAFTFTSEAGQPVKRLGGK